MMLFKRFLPVFALFLLSFYGCSRSNAKVQDLESKDGMTVLPVKKSNESVADFAGGCFWAMQECMLELKGVNTVVSGYAGGTTTNPTYDSVLSKKTGHAESVQVYYDPSIITYKQLAEAFFYAHDPTQVDRQGPDVGDDYRSIAFYRSPEEYKILREVSDQIDESKHYSSIVVTELTPFKEFYPAESEHQDYYVKNPWSPYIRNVSEPKVMKLRKALPALIKPEYLK
jgi:peptide-methionine (S)-S-oxide reductase